ncbi:MAG: 23S rRNA pseudouridine(1911/1915/1917) synthase RluD [Halieaceae bacterium]|jgi:23S rRNA pseudouridine1911/1915/1917 synthase|nr:23S rRNA pseudouridine(1911/1915/1917) synthase RluD [Halieaceae bacterium]
MLEHIEQEALVTEEQHGKRLDQVAAELFPEFSRSRLQAWIRSGELLIDGAAVKPRDKVSAGARLTLVAALEEAVSWQGEAIELDLYFEDADILVLNKPPGLVVHPAAGHSSGTLVNALLNQYPELANLPRAGIVHRLDKDTSGLMVVARSLRAHTSLVEQLQARSVSREYAAVTIGAMTGGGTVDAPIGRHPKQRKKMAVVHVGGKPAVTHYRVAERFGHHTHVAVHLETGRTHQIRVHMAHIHYPLVGDPQYGGRPRLPRGAEPELVDTLRGFPRQALHARRLGLVHPGSGEEMLWESELPDDMEALLDCLRRCDAP